MLAPIMIINVIKGEGGSSVMGPVVPLPELCRALFNNF